MSFTAALDPNEMDALSKSLADIGGNLKGYSFPAPLAQAQLGYSVVVEAAEEFRNRAHDRADEVGQWVEKSAEAVKQTLQEFVETDEKSKADFRKVARETFFSADRED